MNRFVLVLLAFAPILTEAKKVKVNRRSEFVKIFSKCHKADPSFDDCMRDALNEVRPYFRYGVPEFNIPPFDPFFAEEVIATRGGQNVNFKLTLRNIYESGWTESKVYRFKSDLKNGIIRYFQFFPSKFLQGEWEFESNFMGPYSNSGTFDLSLYNYTQVTTVRSRRGYSSDSYTPYAVRIQAIDSGDMELHISNLFNGVSSVEYFLDRIINMSWRPGFMLLKPLIDDLNKTEMNFCENSRMRSRKAPNCARDHRREESTGGSNPGRYLYLPRGVRGERYDERTENLFKKNSRFRKERPSSCLFRRSLSGALAFVGFLCKLNV